MGIDGDYEPSPSDWVRRQVEQYEASGGTQGNTLADTGQPIIIMTTVGRHTGKVRKVPLMRIEHEGEYALVASKGGAPTNPAWYHNLVADPNITIQDGPEPIAAVARVVSGEERVEWWHRAVDAFPPVAALQERTDREIPVFVAGPTG